MSGVLRAVGTVAGIVAVVASGPVGAIAGGVAVAASLGAELTQRRPVNERQGLQLTFKIDPNGPITYPIGRTAVGGTIVHRETHGTTNHYSTYFVDLGLGPIHAIETALIDRAAVAFSGTSALGYYANWLWQDRQLGATPEARALGHGVVAPPFGSVPAQVPGWSALHRLSGHAAASLTMLFDTKARRYANGEPTPGWILLGNLVWDPRLDSTWPGGIGPCRRDNPSTWVYSETAALHGLRWRLGIYQNGKRILGIGAPIDLIDVARIVEAANVQEANGWTAGGELNSGMDRWEALKLIEQAGGAEPVPAAATMSTLQKMPRVAVGAITDADIVGRASIPGSRPRRERINGFRARFRSEAHGWEMVPVDLVEIADYVAADGVARAGSADFALVQDKDQAAQLAAYEVYDSRELGPIELQLKPRFIGYRIGDALALNATELGLVGLQAVIRGRRIDPRTGIVTLRLVTDTGGKHAAALGRTGVAPPVPTLTYAPLTVAAPAVGEWQVAGGTIGDGEGHTIPAIVVTGAVGNPAADGVVFDFRAVGTGEWTNPSIESPDTARKVITDVAPRTAYEVGVRNKVAGIIGDRLILGPVTTGADSVADKVDALELGAGSHVFFQNDEPPSPPAKLNDLWLEEDTGKAYVYLGEGTLEQLAIGTDELEVIYVGGEPVYFGRSGGWVLTKLSGAVSAGGNVYYLQEDPPAEPKVGDSWFRPSTGVLSRWSGTDWVATADRTAQVVPTIAGIVTVQIAASSTGVTTTPLPKSLRLRAMEGATDRSTGAHFVLGTLPGGLVATINDVDGSADRGVLTITRADAGGPIPVTVTFPGGGVRTDVVTVQRTVAPQDATGNAGGAGGAGTGASEVSARNWYDPIEATHRIVTPILTVRTGSAGDLTFAAYGAYGSMTPASANVAIKAAYRAIGTSAWTDVAGEQIGAPAIGDYEPGFVAIPETVEDGLTAGTDYEVALFARLMTAARQTYWNDAVFSVRGS